MPLDSPDETLSWSDEQIEHEIASSVSDLDFVCEWVGAVWSARIETHAGKGETPRILHVSENVDRRLALMDVYGYLWLKEQEGPVKGSLWDPEQPRPVKSAVPKTLVPAPDPGDLDPNEIVAVYGIRNHNNGD